MRRLPLLIIVALTSTAVAQTSKLVRSEKPLPATIAGYDKGHCITLPKNLRICKTLSDDKDAFLVEKEGQRVGTWPGNVFLAETSDFEVLTGPLDNDQQPELIVANHDGTSNGMAVDYWTIFIFPDPEFRNFKAPLTFSVQEYGSFGTFVTSGGRVNILTTSWVWNNDPSGRRGWGTYLVGQWWRYQSGELLPLMNKAIIARRYLSRFERERMDTVSLDRVPFQWLLHPGTEAVNTAFITKKDVAKWSGLIREISTETKSGQLKILFKPEREEPVTLIYPLNEGNSRLDYFGDATSGRLYPKGYLPSQADKWLQNRRATLRRYKDEGIQVLWLERR